MELGFFPSRTVTLMMMRMFLLRALAVLALLVIVLQALDLLSEGGQILARPGNGEAQLWTYVSLRAPQLVERFLPFSVLLATIVTLATLNQNSEVVAMKAAGLSAHQVLAPLLLAALLVAGINFAFNDRVVSRATATLNAWEAADFGPIPRDSGVRADLWVRDGANIFHANSAAGRGPAMQLAGAAYYRRDANGALFEILTAERARPSSNGWLLEDAYRFDVRSARREPVGDRLVAQGVAPAQFLLSRVEPEGMSFAELSDAIDEMRAAGKRTAELEANLWHKLSGPLSSLLMPLLGAVSAFGLARSGQLVLRAVLGMALGFAYFVIDNFALAMGNLGAYPPLLAAWSPFLLFLLIGETVLVRTEE